MYVRDTHRVSDGMKSFGEITNQHLAFLFGCIQFTVDAKQLVLNALRGRRVGNGVGEDGAPLDTVQNGEHCFIRVDATFEHVPMS